MQSRSEASRVAVRVLGAPGPAELIAGQPVYEDRQARSGLRERVAQRGLVQPDSLTVHPRRGGLGKRAAIALQPVPDQTVEHGDPETALLGGGQRNLLTDAAPLHRRVDGLSEPRGARPDRAVGAARERVVDELHRQGRRPHAAEGALGDAQVHVADRARETAQVVKCQGAQRPNLIRR